MHRVSNHWHGGCVQAVYDGDRRVGAVRCITARLLLRDCNGDIVLVPPRRDGAGVVHQDRFQWSLDPREQRYALLGGGHLGREACRVLDGGVQGRCWRCKHTSFKAPSGTQFLEFQAQICIV